VESYTNLCKVSTLKTPDHVFKILNFLWFESCHFLTPLKIKCLPTSFWYLWFFSLIKLSSFIKFQLVFEETPQLCGCDSLCILSASFGLKEGSMRLLQSWLAIVLLPGSVLAQLTGPRWLKDLGNLWRAKHGFLNVWTTCQNFIVIRSWVKKKQSDCLQLGRISMLQYSLWDF
jgi:hypothetical protein